MSDREKDNARSRRYYAKRMSTPEGREKQRERERLRFAKRWASEEGRKKLLEGARRRAKTPEGRAKNAAKQRAWRQTNRDAYQAIQARYAARQRAMNPTKARGKKQPPAPFFDAKFNDALYARIHGMVHRGYAKDTREDIISDIYIGVLDGTYPEEFTMEHVRHAAGMVLKQVAPADTVSLDAVVGPDGSTRGHLLGVY